MERSKAPRTALFDETVWADEVVIRAVRLGDAIAMRMAAFFGGYGLTTLQYDVLRILKVTLGKPLDADLIARIETDLGPRMRQAAGFLDSKVVVVSDTEAFFIVLFASHEALVEGSRDVAAPWFAEHVRPYLAGPVQRSVDEVVAHVSQPCTAEEQP